MSNFKRYFLNELRCLFKRESFLIANWMDKLKKLLLVVTASTRAYIKVVLKPILTI